MSDDDGNDQQGLGPSRLDRGQFSCVSPPGGCCGVIFPLSLYLRPHDPRRKTDLAVFVVVLLAAAWIESAMEREARRGKSNNEIVRG